MHESPYLKKTLYLYLNIANINEFRSNLRKMKTHIVQCLSICIQCQIDHLVHSTLPRPYI